jgi:hypothetical protein
MHGQQNIKLHMKFKTKHEERERERERERELGKSRCRWEGKTEMNQNHTGRALVVTCSELPAQPSAS